jgi:hypothetical protein
MQRKFENSSIHLIQKKKSEIEHPKSQIDIMGVTCGPRYPLIRLQALRSLAGIRYYR